MLEYVYDKTEKNISGGFKVPALNIVLLGGSMIGQVVFGIWADLVGRRKIYGLELIITITATICVAMSATGAENSMDIFGWLFFWRLVIGVGVGVEYPLSAVITSESVLISPWCRSRGDAVLLLKLTRFAPTQYRGRMLAVVFSTQSLGQTIAAVMAIICTAGAQGSIQSSIPLERIRAVDRIWRLIAGLGTIPAAMALFSRLRIPETARYYMEIEGNSMKAESSVREQFNLGPPKFLPAIEAGDNILPAVLARNQTFTERPAGPVNNLSNDHPGSKRPPTPSSASAIIHVRKERPPIPGNNSNDYADGSQPPVSIGSSNIPIGNGRPPIPADSLNSLAHGSRSPMPLSNRPSVPLSNFTNNHISIAPQMSPISPASHVPKRYRVADESPVQKLSLAEFGDYLWEQGGLFLLLGKSLSWFTMDFAFYGLSLSVHHIISSLRGHPELSDDYQRLIDNGTDSLLVVSLGAMIGSTIMIIFVNKSSRRSIQFWGFFRLGLAFFIIGASYNTWVSTQNWACFIISYTIIQALFNWGTLLPSKVPLVWLLMSLGPNTTTFMVRVRLKMMSFVDVWCLDPSWNISDPFPLHLSRHLRRLR